MAEATRLTRQGRLIEATALIQQTLASPAVTRRAPESPSVEEATGETPGRYSDPQPESRAASEGARLGQVHSGWLTRLRRISQPGRIGSAPGAPGRGPGHHTSPASRFEAFSYTNAAGTRAYRGYIPAGPR